MADIGFDTSTIPESESSFDALPPGWYPAQAIESDYVKKEPGVREYAKFTFEIIEGRGAGRKVWLNCLNMVNPNQQAQEIGRREFQGFCKAAGTGPVGNTEALHHKAIMIKLAIDKDDADKNVIKGFKAYQAGAAAPASTPAAAPSAPWGKK